MALTIKKSEVGEETHEEDTLPGEVEGSDVVAEEEKARQLELENAELKGKLSVLQPGQVNPSMSHEQTKAKVYADINNMTDEQFEAIYKMPKYQASSVMLDRDNSLTKAEVKQLHAESEAKTELAAKYGADFYKYKSKIEESLADLSEDARRDPKRLARYMERVYTALVKDTRPTPKPGSVKGNEDRRKVVADFEKPGANADPATPPRVEISDEIAEVDRSLAKNLGLTSEKERKEYADMGYVPMNMGDGVWFKDPKRGFEKVAPTQ